MKTTEEMFWEVYAIMQNMAEQFKELAKNEPPPDPTIDEIINAVCKMAFIDPGLIRSKTRKRDIVEPRQLCFALIMFGLKLSCERVGEQMGQFDHATVLYGISKVSERYKTYKDYRVTTHLLIESLFKAPERQQYIIERIIDPHLDRKHSYAKLETA